MNKTKAWISAFRLRTLPLSFSVILMGSGLAFMQTNSNSDVHDFSWLVFTFTLLTTLLLQILSNLANDYGDALKGADNHNRIGPERAIQSGLISPGAMLKAIIINSILSLISGVLLLYFAFQGEINWIFISFIIVGIAAIAAAIKYTVGKGAYGYSGLGDLFVFVFFGLVGVIGTMYLQVHELNWTYLIPATTMGCFSVAVLNLNNMRDRENDQAVGKNTLAVILGFKKSKIYHYSIFILAYITFPLFMVFATFYSENYSWLIPISLSFIFHAIHIRKVASIEDPKDFDPELKKIALSAFLFSLLYFVAFVFFS